MNVVNQRGQTPWLITQGEYQAGSFIAHTETGEVLARLGADTKLGKDLGGAYAEGRQNNDDANLETPLRPVSPWWPLPRSA